MTLYIGNLSYDATEENLREVFEKYGEIRRIVLPVDRETGKRRGFAFVELVDESQETAAIEDLDGATWLGRVLKVNKAKPKQ
ncbi:RNA-binding protein [Thermosynechococcaceae cyanobacterium Okahandja]